MRFCIAVRGWVLSWIITTPWLNMTRRLFWIMRCNFLSELQQTDCGTLRQEVHKQNTFSVPKRCAHDLPSWSGLFEFHLCWRWSVPPLHGLLLRLRGFVGHPSLVPCDYMAQGVFAIFTVLCQSNVLACCFNLCFSVKIFGTQFTHNFRNLTLPYTIWWRSDHEIWGKCRQSDVMENRTFFLIFSSNARTKYSFTTDNRPLHKSSYTFYCPSLNSHTHLHTIELLTACSPYKSQSWQISAGFMFFTFKKKNIDRIPHAAVFSIFLNIINTARCVDTVRMSANCFCALPQNQKTQRMRKFVTAVLRWQY